MILNNFTTGTLICISYIFMFLILSGGCPRLRMLGPGIYTCNVLIDTPRLPSVLISEMAWTHEKKPWVRELGTISLFGMWTEGTEVREMLTQSASCPLSLGWALPSQFQIWLPMVQQGCMALLPKLSWNRWGQGTVACYIVSPAVNVDRGLIVFLLLLDQYK